MTPDVKAFVQARMGSTRFPGKVLAPYRGEAIIVHVVRALGEAVGSENVVVATTDQRSDDPLVAYLESMRVACFRGPERDVLERFRRCAQAHPSEWILRISADSPLLSPQVVSAVVGAASDDVDVVTTVLGAGNASGTHAELVRSSALLGLPPGEPTEDDREHVMPFFYRHPDRYRLLGVDVPASDARPVDTVEDLAELEAR